MQTLLIDGFFSVCYLLTMVNDWFVNMYTNTSIFRTVCDSIYNPLEYIYCLATFQRLEPKATYWCSQCWITLNLRGTTSSLHQFNFVENIQFMEESCNTIILTLYEIYVYYMSLYSTMDSNYKSRYDPLYIIKNITEDNKPYYNVYQSYNPPENYGYFPSTVRFLSVTYNHPDMENSIELNVNSQWLMTGNQLFTPTFILRALEYQSKHYVFDDEYKIKIVDSNINMLEFGINKHIELLEQSYMVVSVSNDDTATEMHITTCPLSSDSIPPLSTDTIPPLSSDSTSTLSIDSIPPLSTDTIPPLSTDSTSTLSTDSIPPLSTDSTSTLSTDSFEIVGTIVE